VVGGRCDGGEAPVVALTAPVDVVDQLKRGLWAWCGGSGGGSCWVSGWHGTLGELEVGKGIGE